jgi:3-phenylpropionate/cinnamic acid dioxygenase small subunit
MPDVSDCDRVRGLVSRAARALDAGAYEQFLDLFTDDGRYRIEALSAELGKPMTWMDHDRSELASLFKEYPDHVVDKATRLHLVTTDEVELAGDSANALSTFAVFRTDLHGASALYAVGHYEDVFVRQEPTWKLKSRKVCLETRQFTVPTPLPL